MPTESPTLLDGLKPEVSAPPALFADIVFDRPLDHAYTYSVPAALHSAIGVGRRIEAPFGRGDKATVGYCVGVHNDAPSRIVKDIFQVLDAESLVTDSLLRLTRWMADYYLCGWGQVLKWVVPAGARDQSGLRAAVFVEALAEEELPKPLPNLTSKQTAAWNQLRRAGQPLEQRQLARMAQCGTGPVAALVDKKLARISRQKVERLSLESPEPYVPAPPITLNADQVRVWAPIEQALHSGGFHAFLLHGVTGSGKTEIYLRAIEEVIRQGKEALVLVPEISLTPQTIARFRGRCGEVAVLHSHLGDVERGAYWRRVAAGQVQVVVGARSAVFAPARKLGLIVIDEEHESSFKQESTPRYHGRDVAVMRARLENIPIIMGSATPALESWHNAQRGSYTLLSLPNRVLEREMPHVRLIDMRHDGPRGRMEALSPMLEQAMREALTAGGQVMLLLNRRGYSTHVHCPSCGFVATCKNCDLAMTYHRQRTALVCHYCAYEQAPYQRCPMCQKAVVRYQGLGTEKLQSEIESKFPAYVVQRMDSDSMQRPGSHQRVLDAFRNGQIHILLGTQMIAKGLDFPNVTLVGVVNADVGLHIPDFRAAERTFQLLAQVAGRTGRGHRGGRVLVQTLTPEHPAIALATAHDYITFAKQELEHRHTHHYPPYQRLARLIVRSLKQEAAERFTNEMAAAFQDALRKLKAKPGVQPPVRLLGPAEAPVFRLNNYFRYHFQLQSASPALLHQVLREVLAAVRPPNNVESQLDVDPYNML
ncbi:MAG TPA: primosomal protein N' [Gemmataceae bacterium]|jgi:primosomal protein N' (replication factor Y)|nr:primosomal protein N' [Gemmataceae bacterium]